MALKFKVARTRDQREDADEAPEVLEDLETEAEEAPEPKPRKRATAKAPKKEEGEWFNRVDLNPPEPNQTLINQIVKGQSHMASVFEQYRPTAYPYNYEIELTVKVIAGGTPSDPKVAEGWLKTKLGVDKDDVIRSMVAEVMLERGVTMEEATQIVNMNKHLNGFKRGDSGLYIEGRQAKAAIKEAANVRWPKDRWGPTRKGTLSFFAEHVFVPEDRIYLNEKEKGTPTGINQRFVHTFRGSGIQYEEFVEDAHLRFHVITDYDFTDEQWGHLWLTGEQQGIGASRSQGYGKYEVSAWKRV
jgi:hypothetical protein